MAADTRRLNPMNKTLRTAIPLLLLVGVALMVPTAAADPVQLNAETPLDDAIKSRTCSIARVQTNTVSVYTWAGTVVVYGRLICL